MLLVKIAATLILPASVAFWIIVSEKGMPRGKEEWYVYIWMSLIVWPVLIPLQIYSNYFEKRRKG